MVGIIISLIVVFTYFNLCVLPSDGQTDRQAVWEKWSLIQACDPWISLLCTWKWLDHLNAKSNAHFYCRCLLSAELWSCYLKHCDSCRCRCTLCVRLKFRPHWQHAITGTLPRQWQHQAGNVKLMHFQQPLLLLRPLLVLPWNLSIETLVPRTEDEHRKLPLQLLQAISQRPMLMTHSTACVKLPMTSPSKCQQMLATSLLF